MRLMMSPISAHRKTKRLFIGAKTNSLAFSIEYFGNSTHKNQLCLFIKTYMHACVRKISKMKGSFLVIPIKIRSLLGDDLQKIQINNTGNSINDTIQHFIFKVQ